MKLLHGKRLPRLKLLMLSPFVLLLVRCGETPMAAGKTSATPVKIEGYIVNTGEIASVVQASGTLIPGEETVLFPEISGRVVNVSIPEGQRVSKGTLLVKLFDSDLQAELKKKDSQIAVARETEQRLSQLLKVNGVARQEYDQAVLQLNVLKSEYEIIEVQISKTEIRAPFDGVVGLKNISEGAYINSQIPVCTIRATRQLKLDFSVPEKYGRQVNKGLEVTFRTEGDTSLFTASVQATEQSVEVDTRSLKIRAIVENSSGRLIPGSFANVNVPLGKKTDGLMIPSQSIIPQARNKSVIVCRNGKAVFVPIETGVRQASMVEVIKGLAVGDTIATTGIMFIRPDAPITFSEIR